MSQKFNRIPPIQFLVAFEAVARHQRFGAAAEELCVSQSAISHRIRELEKFLGVVLFERHTRSVELTLEGVRFLDQITDGLSCIDSAVRAIRTHREKVKLSILPSFARFWLLPRLVKFQKARPDILLEINSTTRLANIEKGEADISVRFGRMPNDDFVYEKLMDDEWFPVANRSYLDSLNVSTLADVIRTATLIEHKRQPWTPWLDLHGFAIPDKSHRLTFTDTALMIDAAMCCEGIALVRGSLVRDLISNGSLVRLSPTSLPSESAYWIISSKSNLQRTHLRAVFDWLHGLTQNHEDDAEQHARDGKNLTFDEILSQKYGTQSKDHDQVGTPQN